MLILMSSCCCQCSTQVQFNHSSKRKLIKICKLWIAKRFLKFTSRSVNIRTPYSEWWQGEIIAGVQTPYSMTSILPQLQTTNKPMHKHTPTRKPACEHMHWHNDHTRPLLPGFMYLLKSRFPGCLSVCRSSAQAERIQRSHGPFHDFTGSERPVFHLASTSFKIAFFKSPCGQRQRRNCRITSWCNGIGGPAVYTPFRRLSTGPLPLVRWHLLSAYA